MDNPITNPFVEGQEVVCISEAFPVLPYSDYGREHTGQQPNYHPRKGEVLNIDEILGDFLRFAKYDTRESYNWWCWDRFAPVEAETVRQEEPIAVAIPVR